MSDDYIEYRSSDGKASYINGEKVEYWESGAMKSIGGKDVTHRESDGTPWYVGDKTVDLYPDGKVKNWNNK